MDILYIIQILIGFVGLVLIAFPFSSNIKIINYRHIIYAILFQLVLAFILIKIPVITNLFSYLADGVAALQVQQERVQNLYLVILVVALCHMNYHKKDRP